MSDLPLRFLLATNPEFSSQVLREAAQDHGVLVAETHDGGEVVSLAEDTAPDIAFLDLRLPGLGGLEAVRQLHDLLPQISTVILTNHPTLDDLRDAMGCGVDSLLLRPVLRREFDEELQRLLEIRGRNREQPAKLRQPSQGIWSFVSAKTGEARTTTLLAFAAQLGMLGHDVVVVDLDIHFGDIGFYLGLPEGQPDVFDAIEGQEALAGAELQQLVRTHPSGISVLTAPAVERTVSLDLDWGRLVQVVENLAELYTYVLVDLPVGIPAQFIPLLDRSRLIFLASKALPSTVHSNRRLVEILRNLGYSLTKLQLLVLEQDSKEKPEIVADGLGFSSGMHLIPNIPEAVEAAVRSGFPLFHDAPTGLDGMGIRRLVLRHVSKGSSVIAPMKPKTDPVEREEPASAAGSSENSDGEGA